MNASKITLRERTYEDTYTIIISYSLQPFIFYEVAYKISSEYVLLLFIVKLCQTHSSNLLTVKDFVCSQFF